MKLNLITANTTLEGQRRLYAKLNAQDTEDARHIFIVPDRYTLSVEQDICNYCFPDGYTRVDVVSFTRFAVKTVGRKIKKCLSKEGTVILLDKVMRENADKLCYYKKLTGYGFAKETFAALASLRSSNITPEIIEAELPNMDGVIKNKLSDMAVIMRAYDKELQINYSDTITRIDALVDYLKFEGLGEDAHVYVLGFNFYSAQQMAVIKALIKASASVSIPTVTNRGATLAQISELMEYCAENEIPVDREEAFENVREPFETARRLMFTGKKEGRKPENGEAVRLFSERNPYEEALAAAREIIFLTRRENYRFKEVAVVCNDVNLLPVIRETFERTGVPCFIDEGYLALDGVAVKYILNVLRAAESRKPTDVFKIVGHPLFGIDEKRADNFERYCVKFNVRYRRFSEPFVWGDAEDAEEVRRKLISLLDSVPSKGRSAEYCDWFWDMLGKECVTNLLAEYAKSSDERLRAHACTDDIERLLTDIKMLVGDEEIDLSGFIALFTASAADLKITLRPDCVDSVFVGSSEESRFSKVKALFVLGAADGTFPQKSGDGLIFTASDNENMRRHGLAVYPSPIEKNEFERFIVRDLLAKPTDRLYVGCAETDMSGEAQNAGEGFLELKYLTENDVKPLESYHDFSDEELVNYRLASMQNAYFEYVSGRVPPSYAPAVREMLVAAGLLKENTVKDDEYLFEKFFKVDDEGNFVTSVSQLETYFACPFKHFMRYGVKAEPEEDSVLRPNTLGTIIHNILEWFFKNRLEKIYTGENLDGDIKFAIKNELSKSEYERFFADPISKYILDGVARECVLLINGLAENMRESDFRPIDIEVGFGYRKDDNLILIEANNRKFKLCGRIDRVDAHDKDVVIIDYKTGTAKPELKEVACGKKIQLYVYLSYYVKQGYRPAGVFYLPIRSGNSEIGRRYAFVGQIRGGEVFKALDRRAEAAEGKYVSPAVGINAQIIDGEVKFDSKNNNILTEADFLNVADYVEKLMETGLGEIMDGYAERKPLEGECKYCDFRNMCGEVQERKTPSVKVEHFRLSLSDEKISDEKSKVDETSDEKTKVEETTTNAEDEK